MHASLFSQSQIKDSNVKSAIMKPGVGGGGGETLIYTRKLYGFL